ncbi:MAG: beta-propeller fold lactonase family protein [Bacteroidetes bacterium]|nr:beta-propeller fold lactonase family protein [Bacteroidota bacterium]
MRKTIEGGIRPKSIVHNGSGLFFAQNMMYKHTITVYNRSFNLVKTISDKVNLSDYDLPGYSGLAEGAPVEVAFSSDLKTAWISNYKMYGEQFKNPGQDNCRISPDYDQSFIYKVNTQTLEIESLIEVGCVPKYVAATPDNQLVLVSNWCSGDLSIIDTQTETETHRIPLGRYPRGIVIDSKSRYAYVTIMGSDKIAVIKLADYSLSWITDVGKTPRHLCISPSGRYLYVSLSREGAIAKIDLVKGVIVEKTETGKEARSMVITPGGRFIYVVNYDDNTVSKLDTESMKVLSTAETNEKPIGITFDPENKSIWVACYSGSIMVFEDEAYRPPVSPPIDPSVAGPLPPVNNKSDDPYLQPFLAPPGSRDGNFYIYKEPETVHTDPLKETQIQDLNDPMDSRSYDDEKWDDLPDPVVKSRNLDNLSSPVNDGRKYHVVVGSYENQKNALLRVRKLKSLGFQPSVIPTDTGKFRVSCAFYDSRDEAKSALEKLKVEHNIEGWIYSIE